MNPESIELAYADLAGGPLAIDVGGSPIGVFRVGEAVYAIDDLCPHAHASLHEGHVDGAVVECAFHNARFHLPTGKCLSGPATDVRSYPVRRNGPMILIDCRRPAAAGAASTANSPKETSK